MARCLKTFLYNLTHDIVFYIMTGLAIVLLIICYNMVNIHGDFNNHIVIGEDPVTIYVQYEKEDPKEIAKQSIYSYTDYEPVNESLAYDNNLLVITLTAVVFYVIFLVVTIYQVVFFGRLYKNGVIKNYVIAGISKTKVFTASFISSELYLLFNTALAIAVIAATAFISQGYPIIYWPEYILYVLCAFLVLSVMSTFVLVLIFLSQNQMISLILPVTLMFAILFAGPQLMDLAGTPKYQSQATSFRELEEGHHELYFDSETLFRDLYVDGVLYDQYDENKINPDYPGDTVHNVASFAFKSNVLTFTLLAEHSGYHSLIRDGGMLRYSLLSCCYTVLLFASGCIIARKRNLN